MRARLFNRRRAMKILTMKQTRELVLYSPTHIYRLEKAGQFPKRVKLGEHRIGFLESEILVWLKSKIDLRSE